MDSDSHSDSDKKRVLNLYAAFGVCLLLSIIPSAMISLLALIFGIGVLIGAYRLRSGADTESLAYNHGTFIIRTIWIATFISLIMLAAGSLYMISVIDYTPFEPCAQDFAAKGSDFAQNATYPVVYAMAEPCMNAFLDLNLPVLLMITIIVAAPVLIYLAYRYIKGLSRAIKGYRLAAPRSWF